jgi:TPP-dependent pyruvate/acetoin dehydrogenase alpha subunit
VKSHEAERLALLRTAYDTCLTIRTFEEMAVDMYRRGMTPGLVHASIGQEAVATAVALAMAPQDYLVSTHRGHGHCLARGMTPLSALAEILGRSNGCCRGKGGSMHLADPTLGILGANGIVGGGIGIALGAAFAASYRNDASVSVLFIGEGVFGQGLLYETLNLASLWSLPLAIVCENNAYIEFRAAADLTAGRIKDRVESFDVKYVRTDGMDFESVFSEVESSLEHARSEQAPVFIEAETYRFHGHHVAEAEGTYRTKDEVERWRARDPILLLETKLRELSDEDHISATRQRIVAGMESVKKDALESPWPELDSVLEDVPPGAVFA